MAKKSRVSSKKKNRKIEMDDNVMVGGLLTDIVIPCDSIHRYFISLPLLTNFSVVGPPGAGKSTVSPS